MVEEDVIFVPPPEAPVYEPTEEEFADPLAYIAKIRPEAELCGICKIRPPPDWQPPFAVDVDVFKFVPRVQRLNELEAKTRVKLNFLDSIAKFWELQGCRLRLPYVNGKSLDLYNLKKFVNSYGGFEAVCKEKKWSKVAIDMGYPQGKNIGHQLGKHYERMLWPYDVFNAGIPLEEPLQPLPEGSGKDRDYVPHGIISRQAIIPSQSGYSRRSKRQAPEGLSIDITNNPELKKLQLYGPGPKFQGLGLVVDTSKKTVDKVNTQEGILDSDRQKVEQKATTVDPDYQGPKAKKEIKSPKKSPSAGSSMQMRDRSGSYSLQIELYICHMCGKGDAEDCLLLCDGCDDSFHTFCLLPPLPEVPKGDWRCPKCLAVACSKKKDPFGFEQASKEYTLESFGKMADQFKKDFFSMPVHMVPPEQIEKEFWRLVTTIDEDVCVQYGADIHSLNHSSGFPTKNTKNLAPEDEEYVHSGWNLNNLAVQEASVLHHINVDISGMKVPWMYVGMCFSAFCWHNEDHWSYSINYLHWGEPKTWYGVSGQKAELFEAIMKEQAPELFAAQPDLLHQLVTIMSPTVLMKKDVPIYRTNQCAGEFVITFPRAYHAGFNQGYNFAEAVNFCPIDWLPMGRLCIEHYRRLHRFCVFSHEELIAKMAADPDSLDLTLAAAVHKELLAMVEVENRLRKKLLERGTSQAERETFELLADDERQCDHCKTTCFLSAITCPCTPNKLVCIHHVQSLCDCDPSRHCLRYRYTLDELPAMLHRLKIRAECFDSWANRVKDALNPPTDTHLELSDLKELLEEADEKNFPDNDSLQDLITAIAEAEKCSMIAIQLINRKQKQSNMKTSGDKKYITRINLDELKGFVQTVDQLPCVIAEGQQLSDLLQEIESFILVAQQTLEDAIPNSAKLQVLLAKGNTFDIELPEIPKLKQELIQAKWLDEVRNALSNAADVTLDLLRKLIDSGVNLAPHPAIEKAMTELQELLSVSESWEEKAKGCLNAKLPHTVAVVDALISESQNIPAVLPNMMALQDALRNAKDWCSMIDDIQNGEHFPYLDVLERMVCKGRPIPIRLEQMSLVESQVAATRLWRDRTARTFLKKNTQYSLIEVLTPRGDIGSQFMGKPRKKKSIFGDLLLNDSAEEGRDPSVFLSAFKSATESEVGSMKVLRDKNRRKQQMEEDGTEPGRYCVCKKPVSGYMLRCELCKDWYHTLCVPVPKSVVRQTKPNLLGTQPGTIQGPHVKEMKFMCPYCVRSRRPKLETILSLLVSLQKLPVRLPEGEALQCLTERAMNWQDKAKQILSTEEVTAAFAQVAFMGNRGGHDQGCRKHSMDIMHRTEEEDDPYMFSHDSYSDTDSSHRQGLPSVPHSYEKRSYDDYDMDDEGKLVIDVPHPKEMALSSEHAYSSASRAGHIQAPSKKHSRKTPHTVRQTGPVSIELSPKARAQLEEILLEGDLLEVSLEETRHIWRILQSSQPVPIATKMMEHFVSHLTEEAYEKMMQLKVEHKQKRSKRKLSHEMSALRQDVEGAPESKKKKKKKDRDRSDASKIHIKSELRDSKKKSNKRAEKGTEGKEKLSSAKREEELIVVDGDEEDDEICSAKRCLQPAGDDINWVQCDSCEKWYHLLCIGMTSQPLEDEEYVCKICVKRKAAQKSKQKQRAKLAAQKAMEAVTEMSAENKTTAAESTKEDIKPTGLVPVALMRVEDPVEAKQSAIKVEPMEIEEDAPKQQLGQQEKVSLAKTISFSPEPMGTDFKFVKNTTLVAELLKAPEVQGDHSLDKANDLQSSLSGLVVEKQPDVEMTDGDKGENNLPLSQTCAASQKQPPNLAVKTPMMVPANCSVSHPQTASAEPIPNILSVALADTTLTDSVKPSSSEKEKEKDKIIPTTQEKTVHDMRTDNVTAVMMAVEQSKKTLINPPTVYSVAPPQSMIIASDVIMKDVCLKETVEAPEVSTDVDKLDSAPSNDSEQIVNSIQNDKSVCNTVSEDLATKLISLNNTLDVPLTAPVAHLTETGVDNTPPAEEGSLGARLHVQEVFKDQEDRKLTAVFDPVEMSLKHEQEQIEEQQFNRTKKIEIQSVLPTSHPPPFQPPQRASQTELLESVQTPTNETPRLQLLQMESHPENSESHPEGMESHPENRESHPESRESHPEGREWPEESTNPDRLSQGPDKLSQETTVDMLLSDCAGLIQEFSGPASETDDKVNDTVEATVKPDAISLVPEDIEGMVSGVKHVDTSFEVPEIKSVSSESKNKCDV